MIKQLELDLILAIITFLIGVYLGFQEQFEKGTFFLILAIICRDNYDRKLK